MGITLKAARINAKLTQVEAAHKLGVSKESIGNWEKGKNFPNVQMLSRIEELYKIAYKDIIFLPDSNA